MNLKDVIFFLTVVTWTSSSSAVDLQINLDNVTLPYTLEDLDCSNSTCADECDNCDESLRCICCSGYRYYRGMCSPCDSQVCGTTEDCCDSGYICIDSACRYPDPGIDFVTVAKIALASALLITMIAVFSICWKGFIRPRCSRFYRSQPQEDTASLNSMQRYIVQLLDNRPPRYETEPGKPPSYEECVGASASGDSSFADPPPYSIAIGDLKPDDLPSLYVMNDDAEIRPDLVSTPLNVQCVRTQEVAEYSSGSREELISSPIQDMEDFVAFSESDSSHSSISYNQLHSDTQTITESSSDSCEACSSGIDNLGLVQDNEHAPKNGGT